MMTPWSSILPGKWASAAKVYEGLCPGDTQELKLYNAGLFIYFFSRAGDCRAKREL